MSIKEYQICERSKKKLKVLDILKGTQKRDLLNKFRLQGYIVKKIYV